MPNILPPKPGKHGNHCPTCICGTLPNRDFPRHSYLRPNLAPACNQSLKWRQSPVCPDRRYIDTWSQKRKTSCVGWLTENGKPTTSTPQPIMT